jgi:hypothetical protein
MPACTIMNGVAACVFAFSVIGGLRSTLDEVANTTKA